MFRNALLVFVAGLFAVALLPAGAGAYTRLDYQSAVDALTAADPTITPPPNNPQTDFAVGGFQGEDNNNVGFSAHSGTLGQNPKGQLSETIPLFFPSPTAPATYQGRFNVTCLFVLGKDAALGLTPTDAASNDQPSPFVLAVHDGGPGGAGDLEAFVPNVQPSDCAAFVADAFFPIQRGNILVNDALP